METNIIIPGPKAFEKKKDIFVKGGTSKLHVLSDFDLTLTKAFVNGEKVNSIVSILRDYNYLTPDYPEKAKELFAKYHPIEIDPDVPLNEKKEKMKEWWILHNKLLIASGLSMKDIESIVDMGKVQFREKAKAFLALLNEKEIPLVILSSSALGEAIVLFFEKQKVLYNNTQIISNFFNFDKEGKAVSLKKRVIHVMNKDDTSIADLEIYPELLKRKNVLLLGDSLGDLGMVEGFPYENLIKIGFLDYDIKENLEAYKEAFDVVITGDGDMGFVVDLMKEIIK